MPGNALLDQFDGDALVNLAVYAPGEKNFARPAAAQKTSQAVWPAAEPFRRRRARFQNGLLFSSNQIGEGRIRRIEAEERLHLLPQFRRHAMALEVPLALRRSEVGHLTEQ